MTALFLHFLTLSVSDIITSKNFTDTVKGYKTFIYFEKSNCNSCVQSGNIWKELIEHFNDNNETMIGTMNCDENADFCKKLGAVEVPVMKYFMPGNQPLTLHFGNNVDVNFIKQYIYDLLEDCTPYSQHKCNDEDKKLLKDMEKYSQNIPTAIRKWNMEIKNANTIKENYQKMLIQQFEKKKEEVAKDIARLNNKIRLGNIMRRMQSLNKKDEL